MSTIVGLGILIIAVVYLTVGLIKMLFMFSATIPSFLAGLFVKESRDEIKSIEWDSDTILGFACLFALGGLATWGIIELELIASRADLIHVLQSDLFHFLDQIVCRSVLRVGSG